MRFREVHFMETNVNERIDSKSILDLIYIHYPCLGKVVLIEFKMCF